MSLDSFQADIAERADELRAIKAERLDAAAAALWPAVVAGDLRAQTVWLRNRARYADLLGLDLRVAIPEPAGVVFHISTALPWEQPGHPDYVIDGEIIDAPALTSGDDAAGAQTTPDSDQR